ncbi:MAG: P-loop NTPase fold protein [Candidatus Woesearchaeota archaeon]
MVTTLDNNSLRIMSFFQDKTKVAPSNLIINKTTYIFTVNKNDIQKAIGKNAENVKFLSSKYKKNVIIFELGTDVESTIENFIYPVKLNSILKKGSSLSILLSDPKQRTNLLKSSSKNLRNLKDVINHYYYPIRSIKLV